MTAKTEEQTVRESSPPPEAAYEPPQVRVLGSVHALTQTQNKGYGTSDGFMFMGQPIMNIS